MRRAAGLLLATLAVPLVLVPAPASAGEGTGTGTGTARPRLALTATPAHVGIAGSGRATVRVANPGTTALVVDAGRAGFSLDLRGRPRIVSRQGRRAATSWLSVKPGRFVLPAGSSRALTVSSRLPPRVEPGDHDALVLLTTHRRRSAGVAARLRVGVVVVVRAPGRVVRRLALRQLRVRRAHGWRTLELLVSNQGNVTESLPRGRVRISLTRGGARTSLAAEPRDLRPRTSGVVTARYGARRGGWTTVRVEIASVEGAPVLRRSFRVKL
jgi:hypothetical protein